MCVDVCACLFSCICACVCARVCSSGVGFAEEEELSAASSFLQKKDVDVCTCVRVCVFTTLILHSSLLFHPGSDPHPQPSPSNPVSHTLSFIQNTSPQCTWELRSYMLGYVIGAFLNGHVWGTQFKLEEMHILFSYFFLTALMQELASF